LEEESIQKRQYDSGQNFTTESMTADDTGQDGEFICNNNTKTKAAVPQLRLLHELRAETYNGMIRMLKPGCRTIVVLVDDQSKTKLLSEFHRIVWPYRKYVLVIIFELCRVSKKELWGFINIVTSAQRIVRIGKLHNTTHQIYRVSKR